MHSTVWDQVVTILSGISSCWEVKRSLDCTMCAHMLVVKRSLDCIMWCARWISTSCPLSLPLWSAWECWWMTVTQSSTGCPGGGPCCSCWCPVSGCRRGHTPRPHAGWWGRRTPWVTSASLCRSVNTSVTLNRTGSLYPLALVFHGDCEQRFYSSAYTCIFIYFAHPVQKARAIYIYVMADSQ